MKNKLIETLSAVGKPAETCQAADGSEILVLLYGGRVLGLFAPGSQENFLWTHPALDSVSAAREFYAGDQWHNSGGDRTWLAPEVDFFFPNFPATDSYWQPRQLDPGNYQLTRAGAAAQLTNRLTATLSRSRREVGLLISKSVSAAANPLRQEAEGRQPGIQYAGYTLHTSLTWEQGDDAVAVGLWNLLQVPHGGELLLPTYFKATPKVFFGTIPAGDCAAGERLLRYWMRAAGEHKIGLRAAAVTGRAGYRYPTADGQWALLVRSFAVNPSGLYVDVPWSNTEDFGYAFQACNVNSGLGSFSELEYHVPALQPATGCLTVEDTSQVWAFRGSEEQIAAIAQTLLGATSDHPQPATGRMAREILQASVPQGHVWMWWLGQAGFAFKTPAGKIVYVDPYLSDAVERLHGFKRLSLAPIDAEEAVADFVILSHEHADHLDPDATAVIARNNPRCRFAAPSGCREGLAQAGVSAGQTVLLEADRCYDLGAVTVHTAAADHGDFSPSALALLLDFDGIRVLLTGDTSLRLGLLQPLLEMQPDVVLPCINGVFGNMNHLDAARLVESARPRYAIPCHYGMFAEHGCSDPGGFIHACKHLCPAVQALVLKPGEPLAVAKARRAEDCP